MTDEQLYITCDRFEIYTLLASDCLVKDIKGGGGVVSFCFKDKAACDEILFKLFNKQLVLPIHKIIESMRNAQSIFTKYR